MKCEANSFWKASKWPISAHLGIPGCSGFGTLSDVEEATTECFCWGGLFPDEDESLISVSGGEIGTGAAGGTTTLDMTRWSSASSALNSGEAIGVGGPPNSELSEGVGEGGAGALPLSSLWTSSLPQLTLRIIGGAFLGGIFDAKCEV